MAKLSEMLLAAMGWTDSHLHTFDVGEKRYGMGGDDDPEEEIDEKGVTVLEALRDERRFTYEYDFGDGWEHDVEALADPEDDEHDQYLEWVGGSFDATEFDLATANATLQRIR